MNRAPAAIRRLGSSLDWPLTDCVTRLESCFLQPYDVLICSMKDHFLGLFWVKKLHDTNSSSCVKDQ